MNKLMHGGIARIAIAALLVLIALAGTEAVRGNSHDTPVKLVSNTGQTPGSGGSSHNLAQQFTTGSNETGYVVTEVRVRLSGIPSNTTRTYGTINSDSSGSPGSVLASLSNPASFTDNAVNTFTLDTSITLAKETDYWVVFNVGLTASQTLSLRETDNTDEDSDSLTGWSIADETLWRIQGNTTWQTGALPRMILIRGYAEEASTSTDATLSDIEITDSNSDDVTLSPSFESSTTSYAASVDNDVETITITSTTIDDGATLKYIDKDNNALADADDTADGHQVELDEGANIIKVKVTAEDGITSQTYMIVVTRFSGSLLVRNTHLTASAPIEIGTFQNGLMGQRFTTGSNEGGYTLTSVGVAIDSVGYTGSETVTVRVHKLDETAVFALGDLVTTLTTTSLVTDAVNYFSAPTETTLDPDTEYIVNFHSTGNATTDLVLDSLTSDQQEGQIGWLVEDAYRIGGATIGTGRSFQIEVRGEVNLGDMLVRNTHLPSSTSIAIGNTRNGQYGQRFTTGSNPNGYTVTTVGIHIATVNYSGSETVTARIHKFADSSTNDLGTLVATLTTPTLVTTEVNYFDAPDGTTLNPNTQYILNFHSTGNSATDLSLDGLESNAQQGATGWLIEDTRRNGGRASGSSSFQIEVRGNATPDAKLSALAITDSDSNTVTLSPAFDAATTRYTATVDNKFDQVTVTPTTNDSNATLEYLDASDDTLTDADSSTDGHQVNLAEGANTVKVKVTAEDGTTTKTYVVVVTRRGLPIVGLEFINISVNEPAGAGDDFAENIGVEAERSHHEDITINYSFLHITTEDADFSSSLAAGTVTIPAGDTRADIPIVVVDDNLVEDTERIRVILSKGAYQGPLAPFQGQFTINDQDTATYGIKSIASVEEGSDFTIEIEGDVVVEDDFALQVELVTPTAANAASVDTDYPMTLQDVWFRSQSKSESLTITLPDDNVAEGDEVFEVTISPSTSDAPPTNVTLSPDEQTVTITDNDFIEIQPDPSSLAITEGESGTFTVKLGSLPTDTVTVTLTSPDTGAATLSTGTLTFTTTTWDDTQTVTVSAVEDDDANNESVAVSLSATGGDYAGKTATVQVNVTDNEDSTLVRNTHLTRDDSVSIGTTLNGELGQRFTSGSNPSGYTLTTVGLRVNTVNYTSSETVTVSVNEFDESATNDLGNLIATLTTPAALTASAVNYFDAPGGTTLDPDTQYIVSFHSTGDVTTDLILDVVNSDDQEGADGWLIENTRRVLGNPSGTGASHQIDIRGKANPDSTLSALAITDSDSNAITLSPAFDAATTDYTASVDNDVETITVAPTTNDSDATLEYLDEDENALADADDSTDGQQIDLTTGDNSFKVKVTAEDTTTTKTYTVTVTRLTDNTLVKNTHLTSGANQAVIGDTTNGVLGQRFTTGSNMGGYTLTSVGIAIDTVAYTGLETLTARVHEFDEFEINALGTLVATLTTPTLTAGEVNYFDAPAGTTLNPNTRYILNFHSTGNSIGDLVLDTVSSNDQEGAAGWLIENDLRNTGVSSGVGVSIQIEVRGNFISSDATLGTIALTDSDDDTVTLSPAFTAATTSYTASVPNDIDEITVTTASNDDGATLKYIDKDNNALADADDPWQDGPQGVTGTSTIIAGLEPATSYRVQVRAVNAEGDGEWSPGRTGATASP